jgi:iron complex transport system permease protein
VAETRADKQVRTAGTTLAPGSPAAATRRVSRGVRWDRLAVVRLPGLGWSLPVHVRAVVVTVLLLAGAFAVLCWSLAVGDFPVPLGDVLAALAGAGAEPGIDQGAYVVRTLRLPRALAALVVGAGFGMSGAILQRLVRNPLASPDIIGVNAGAAAAAVFVVVVWNGTVLQVTLGALVGSVLVSAAVYLLAYRRGVTGYRLVLVGIGVTAMLVGFTQYLLTEAEIFQAQRATAWLTGSLAGREWVHVRYAAIGLLVLLPLALALARSLRLLDLGDETARGLGLRVEPARAALLLVAVALAAVGTATAGPIGFVALAAPQIARRLVGARSVGLLPAAACGALLMAAADLAARRIVAPTELPAGVVTAIVGTPYLLYLLARANRTGATG